MRITAVKAVTDWRSPLRGNRPNTTYRRMPSPYTAVTQDTVAEQEVAAANIPQTHIYADAVESLDALHSSLIEDEPHEYHDPATDHSYIDADWWPANMAAQQEMGILPLGWLGDSRPDRGYSYAARAYLDSTSLTRSKDYIKARLKRVFQRQR